MVHVGYMVIQKAPCFLCYSDWFRDGYGTQAKPIRVNSENFALVTRKRPLLLPESILGKNCGSCHGMMRRLKIKPTPGGQ